MRRVVTSHLFWICTVCKDICSALQGWRVEFERLYEKCFCCILKQRSFAPGIELFCKQAANIFIRLRRCLIGGRWGRKWGRVRIFIEDTFSHFNSFSPAYLHSYIYLDKQCWSISTGSTLSAVRVLIIDWNPYFQHWKFPNSKMEDTS